VTSRNELTVQGVNFEEHVESKILIDRLPKCHMQQSSDVLNDQFNMNLKVA